MMFRGHFPIKQHFPLTAKSITSGETGVVQYLAKSFENYFNSRLKRYNKDFENILEDSFYSNTEVSSLDQYVGYPLMSSRVCVMLPILEDPDNFGNILKPFKVKLWLALGITILFLSFILTIVFFKSYFTSFMEVLTIFVGSNYKGFLLPSYLKRFIYLQLFLFGFIFLNFYNSKLSSVYTVPDSGKVLHTIEDIKRANITVWVSRINKRILTYYSRLKELKKELGPLYKYIKEKSYANKFSNLSTSRGYLVPDFLWTFL